MIQVLLFRFCLLSFLACSCLANLTSLPSIPSYWVESLNQVQYNSKVAAEVALGCIQYQPNVNILNKYEYIRVYNTGLHLIVALDIQGQEEDIVKANCNVTVSAGCIGHTYWLMYASVQQSLMNVVETYQKPVILIGHSIGGVVAQVAAYDLLQHNRKVVQLVTFGSPAAGNREFNDWVCTYTRCKRHHNMYDPVVGLAHSAFQYFKGEAIVIGQSIDGLQVYKTEPMLSGSHLEYYGFKRC